MDLNESLYLYGNKKHPKATRFLDILQGGVR